MVSRPGGPSRAGGLPAPWAATLLIAAPLFALACSDRPLAPEGRRLTIEVHGGNDQYGAAGARLTDPLRVRVTDADTEEPVEELPIVWRLSEGEGAAIEAATTLTDTAGIAAAELRLGPDTGSYRITAATNALFGRSVSFSAQAIVAPVVGAIRPEAATAGGMVTVEGQNFGSEAAALRVLFGGMRGRVLSASPTELSVEVPECVPSRTVDVTVRLGSVAGAPIGLQVTGDGAAPLDLEVGDVRRLRGADVECVRLPGGRPGLRFLAVLQNATEHSGRTMPFQLAALLGGDGGDVAEGAATAAPTARAARMLPGGSGPAAVRWEARLRARERRVDPASALGRPGGDLQLHGAEQVPNVGDENTFLVFNRDEELDTVTARVEHVSDYAVLYQDLNAPDGGFTQSDFRAFGDLFDDPIYDTDVGAFGEPSDVDGNDRVIVLFTPVVNALTERDRPDEGFIAGFTYALDLTDQEGSNRAEIFYSIVPDPDGEFSDERSKQDILRTVPPVLAHELQHLIHFYQRHIRRDAGQRETLWLSEALAHMAEELVADSLLARGDSTRGLDFKVSNYVRAYLYLQEMQETSLISEERPGSLELRGAAWLFLKYLMGHHGGQGLLTRLTQTTRTGAANVNAETGQPWNTLFHRWTVALWADDARVLRDAGIDPVFTFANVRLRTTMESLLRPTFPLVPQPRRYQDMLRNDTLPAGSADYVMLETQHVGTPTLHLNLAGRFGDDFRTLTDPQIALLRIR